MKSIRHQGGTIGAFSLRSRLVMLFLALQIPLCMLQFYMYYWSDDSISRELRSAAFSYVTFLRDRFDETVKNTLMQQEFLLTSQNVNAFLTSATHLSNADYYSQLKDIMEQMQSTIYANSTLAALNLFFPTLDQGVSVSSGSLDYPLYSTNSQEHLNGRAFTISDEMHQRTVKRYQEQTSLLSFDGSNFIITTGKSLSSIGTYLVMEAVLNNEVLRAELNAFNTYPDAYTLLTHWDSRTVMGNTRMLDSLEELPEDFFCTTDGQILQTEMYHNGRPYYALYTTSDTLRLTFVRLIDRAYFNAIPLGLQRLLLGFYLLMAAAVMIYVWSTQRFIARPMHDLVTCFEAVGRGRMDAQAKLGGTYEFNALAQGFNAMVGHLRQLIQKDYENTILLQRATLKQMQAQIQPHFLYNSFFLLRHIISMEELDKAADLCNYLGEYFQYITRQNQDFLPLEKEYAHMVNYVAIQSMRFQARLETCLPPLAADMERLLVPRLVLQPLIENVFSHGMSAERTMIQVAFYMEGEDLLVRVDDNGTTLTQERIDQLQEQLNNAAQGGGHALFNIHQRLRLIYGSGYGLELSVSPLGGLRVTMRLRPQREPPPHGQAS